MSPLHSPRVLVSVGDLNVSLAVIIDLDRLHIHVPVYTNILLFVYSI